MTTTATAASSAAAACKAAAEKTHMYMVCNATVQVELRSKLLFFETQVIHYYLVVL